MARSATIERNTKETWIQVALDLDGGPVSVETGIGFFDHMLTAFGFYAKIGLTIQASGDLEVDGHHTVEDTGICLGLALKEALGDRLGIRRFGSSYVPMDEALTFTALDFSNRPYLVFACDFKADKIGGFMHPAVDLLLVQPHIPGAEGDVLVHRLLKKLIFRILKNNTDLRTQFLFLVAIRCDILIVKINFAGGWPD